MHLSTHTTMRDRDIYLRIENLQSRIQHFPLDILRWELLLLVVLVLFILTYQKLKHEKSLFPFAKKSIIIFEILFEKVFDFFNDILGEHQKYRVKSFVLGIFFIILFSNILASVIDFLAISFPRLWDLIVEPTTDANFNIAMALVSTLLMLYLQFQKLWLRKFLYNYFPIFWKDIITIEKDNKPDFIYYPLWILVKAFDILISLFVGILDCIWHIAKVISLSFRLTGNMMSGTILLGMLVLATSSLTQMLIENLQFPIILPLLIVVQGLLVGTIQAFVFALLTAIFIKTATEEE